jgi:tight adherence protein B
VKGGHKMTVILIALLTGFVSWIILISIERFGSTSFKFKAPIFKKTHSTITLDYRVYQLSFNEKCLTLLLSSAVLFFIGFLFYKNVIIAFCFSMLSFCFLGVRRRQLLARRKLELNDQFKQALYALSSSLSVGRSLENAIAESVKDLQMLYTDSQTYIILEFTAIGHKLRNGENVESALKQFSDRTNNEDIRNFAEVVSICKRSGGNLIEVMRRTAAIIVEKIEIQQEIALLVSQKRFESRILSFAPLAIIALLSFSSPDYMQPLYNGMTGIAIMTGALAFLFLCLVLTNKIMKIEVDAW